MTCSQNGLELRFSSCWLSVRVAASRSRLCWSLAAVWLGIAASSAYCKQKMVSVETLVFACSRLILNKLPSNRKLMGIQVFGGSPLRKTRVTATRNRLKMTALRTVSKNSSGKRLPVGIVFIHGPLLPWGAIQIYVYRLPCQISPWSAQGVGLRPQTWNLELY